MRKLFLSVIVVSMAFAGLNAQEGSTFIPLNYNSVKKKVEKSEADIQHPKKMLKASTWMKRGEVYQEAWLVGLEQIAEGTPTSTMKIFYGEPNSVETKTEDGISYEYLIYDNMKYTFANGGLQGWERINKICDDPLRVAMDSYFKASELDEGGKMEPKIKEALTELKTQLKREGVNEYYKNNYDGALESFEKVLEVNSQDMFAGEFDTIMVQYSGIISREIAGKTENNDLYLKAIDYYKELANVDYGGPNTYLQIKNDYLTIGDTVQGLEILKEAYEKYPDTINVIANIADTYVLMKQFEEGVEFMDKVIERNPQVGESYYWKGRLLINLEETEYIEKAVEAYKKAGEIKPTLYYIWYDLGYIYYLQGQSYYEASNEEETDKFRQEWIDKGEAKYKEAIPVLEKAYELNDQNAEVRYETLDILQRLYYKLQMMDDYNRVKELKDQL